MHWTDLIDVQKWRDRPCIIIGGGLSVLTASRAELTSGNTIGINKSVTSFDTDLLYIGDRRFYDYVTQDSIQDRERKQLYRQWNEYKGVTITPQKEGLAAVGNTVLVPPLYEPRLSASFEEGIYVGNNSGTGAISLACALGATPIYLYGFDFYIDIKNRKSNWHEGYIDTVFNAKERQLSEFKQDIEKLAKLISNTFIKVYNMSVTSTLMCFPKLDRMPDEHRTA